MGGELVMKSRVHAGGVAVAAVLVTIDAAVGGHWGSFACGMVLGGINAWWWSR